jgi:hypothetical protein
MYDSYTLSSESYQRLQKATALFLSVRLTSPNFFNQLFNVYRGISMTDKKILPHRSTILRSIGALSLVALLAACGGGNDAPDALGKAEQVPRAVSMAEEETKADVIGSFKSDDQGALKLAAVTWDRTTLAKIILQNGYIVLNQTHSGFQESTPYNWDLANARNNIKNTADGSYAWRTFGLDPNGDIGPGGWVYLNPRMLSGMISAQRASKGNIEISEIAGGTHRPNSLHFAGAAFDVSAIDRKVTGYGTPNEDRTREAGNDTPTSGSLVRILRNECFNAGNNYSCAKISRIVQACKAAGATKVYSPFQYYQTKGDHDNHIHCEW